MTLCKIRSLHTMPFPGVCPYPVIEFGLDKTFDVPRFHPATDIALFSTQVPKFLCYPVVAPTNVTSTKWHGIKGSYGVTWLDLYFDGGFWRYGHLNDMEMAKDARDNIMASRGLKMGQAIGPSGCVGLSIGKPGNSDSARHLHAMLHLYPTQDNYEVLDERWPEHKWRQDKLSEWRKQGCRDLDIWKWAGNYCGHRIDPFTGLNVLVVDWFTLLYRK